MADKKKVPENKVVDDRGDADQYEDVPQRQKGNLGGEQRREMDNDDSMMDDIENAWDDLKEDADAF